jgi:hypothetical protein
VISLRRSTGSRRLTLTAPGYEPAMIYITPDVDARVHLDLERTARIVVRRHLNEPL